MRVSVLVPFQTFSELLAGQQPSVATFIRTPEEPDYLQEPDVLHEISGYHPLLANPWSVEFIHTYGELGLKASREERVFLIHPYWMTIEFGLAEIDRDKHVYSGSIFSSLGEAVYCLSSEPLHQTFSPLEAMRTPYRIDILQPLHLVLPDLKRLFQLAQEDIMALVHEAMRLGLRTPLFLPEQAA